MEPEKKSNGALIGLIVIVVILIIGGIYIAISNKNVIEKTVNSEINIQSTQNEDSAALDSLDEDLQSAETDLNIDVNNLK
jgi:predicted PurR-regulated permease PerM